MQKNIFKIWILAISLPVIGFIAMGAMPYGAINSANSRIYINTVQALRYYGTGTSIFGNGGASLNNTTGNEGYYNTFIGVDSGSSATLTNLSTGAGYKSLDSLTTGISNTAFGASALRNITTSATNTALGNNAGRYRGTGTDTLAVATESTFLGASTRASANSVTNSTVIGYNAVGNGSNTVTLGNSSVDRMYLGAVQAMKFYDPISTTRTMVFGNGGNSLSHTASEEGYNNTFIGYAAGWAVTTGFRNLFAGRNAGMAVTTGSSHVILGDSSATTLEGGTGCTYIGRGITNSSTTATNEIVIGYSAVGKGSNTATIGLLGTAVAFYAPGSYTDTTGSAANLFVGTDGRISRSTSSSRYKTDIKPNTKDTSKIYQINSKEYKHTGDGKEHVGLIAEELARVMPEAVVFNKIVIGKKITKDDEGNDKIELEYSPEPVPDAINWNVIIIALIEENKKLKARVDDLESRILKLEGK